MSSDKSDANVYLTEVSTNLIYGVQDYSVHYRLSDQIVPGKLSVSDMYGER